MRVNEKFKHSWLSAPNSPTGLISQCVFASTVNWSENIVTELLPMKCDLDRLFYVKHGEKRLVKWFDDLDITLLNGQYCSDMVGAMFNNKWSRLYHAMVESLYEPLENYNMTEHEEYDGDDHKTGTDTNSLTHGETVTKQSSGSDALAHGETITTQSSGSDALAHGESISKSSSGSDALQHGESISKSSSGSDALQHGEIIETKTKDLNGDTVETEISSTDPATTKNKVFGFNSTADAGVMDTMSINTGTSKVTTIKDDEEQHTGTDTHTLSGSETEGHTGTDTRTLSSSETEGHTGTDTRTLSGNETEGHTGTDTRTLSGNETEGHTGTDNGSATYNSNMNRQYERDLTRSGNIGVTTSQQMLESEIELRKKLFIEIMFADICETFCIPIY